LGRLDEGGGSDQHCHRDVMVAVMQGVQEAAAGVAALAPAPRPGSVAGVWTVLDGQCRWERLALLEAMLAKAPATAKGAGGEAASVVAGECAALVQAYWH